MIARNYKRREFLIQAAKVSTAIVAGALIMEDMALNSRNPVLKPGFLLYCNKDGSVELRSGKKKYHRVSYYYPGLEVDIILLIATCKPFGKSLNSLCKLYSTEHNEICRRTGEILQELKSKDLIYFPIS